MRIGEREIPRERLVRIFAVWLVVTAITVTLVLISVLPWDVGWQAMVFNAYFYLVGPGLLAAIGLYIAYQSTRPWTVAVGTVFLLFAAISIVLGCAEPGRMLPEGYQHWRNIKLAVDIGLSGPRLLISAEPQPGAFACPYNIQLIPLAIGYAALALGLSTPKSAHAGGPD